MLRNQQEVFNSICSLTCTRQLNNNAGNDKFLTTS